MAKQKRPRKKRKIAWRVALIAVLVGVVWFVHGGTRRGSRGAGNSGRAVVGAKKGFHVKSFLKRQTLWTSPCSMQQLSTKEPP